MKSSEYLRRILSLSSNIIPSFLLINSSKKIILPTYHTVSNTPLTHIKNLYQIKNTKEFTKDIDYILKRFTPIDLNQLIELNKTDNKLSKNYFHLSFDDGLRECYDVILPILKQKGIPATFFLNPNFIDNEDLMHRYKVSIIIEDLKRNKNKKDKIVKFIKRKMGVRREASNFLLTLKYSHNRILNEIAQLTETNFDDYLKKEKPYLNTNQVNTIIEQGFTIGAHSLDHPEYTMISEEEQLRQTLQSISQITEKFNLDYKIFAFPFTDNGVSKNLFNTIHNPSNPLCELSFGVAGLKSDITTLHLQRIPMEKNFSGEELIKGEYLYYYFKSLLGKNHINRF